MAFGSQLQLMEGPMLSDHPVTVQLFESTHQAVASVEFDEK
jgi:hypothetical protein